MKNEQPSTGFPLPTIRRYPIYLRTIKSMIAAGELHISSAVLAERLGLDPVLTRKDLAMAGVPGKPRRGYPSRELCEAINRSLGWDSATDAVLIGAGSLGMALLGYSGFEEHNLSIVAAFDADNSKIGAKFHGVKVRPMEDLPRLVPAGIKGIWNFSSIQLEVPESIIVQNVDLAQSLGVLSHSIARINA